MFIPAEYLLSLKMRKQRTKRTDLNTRSGFTDLMSSSKKRGKIAARSRKFMGCLKNSKRDCPKASHTAKRAMYSNRKTMVQNISITAHNVGTVRSGTVSSTKHKIDRTIVYKMKCEIGRAHV